MIHFTNLSHREVSFSEKEINMNVFEYYKMRTPAYDPIPHPTDDQTKLVCKMFSNEFCLFFSDEQGFNRCLKHMNRIEKDPRFHGVIDKALFRVDNKHTITKEDAEKFRRDFETLNGRPYPFNVFRTDFEAGVKFSVLLSDKPEGGRYPWTFSDEYEIESNDSLNGARVWLPNALNARHTEMILCDRKNVKFHDTIPYRCLVYTSDDTTSAAHETIDCYNRVELFIPIPPGHPEEAKAKLKQKIKAQEEERTGKRKKFDPRDIIDLSSEHGREMLNKMGLSKPELKRDPPVR